MIQIEHIDKSYGSDQVLFDLTLDIPANHVTTIIGPNGAGKSTFLGVIARLLKRDSGKVFIDSVDVLDWETSELAKKMSILKQSNITNLKITIEEVVTFGRYPHSKGRLTKTDQEKIEEALLFVDLQDIKYRYIDELSGGQRQRAFVAALLAQDTDYILLDEPLNNLDMRYMVDTMQLLKRMALQKDKTVIFVLHDINFASSYSDHIIALKDGKLLKKGGVREIINEDVLKELYGLEFNIIENEGKPVCLYY